METPPVPPAGTPPPEEPTAGTPPPEAVPPPSASTPPPEAPLLPAPPSTEERTWAMAAHLSALAGHFIPFGHIFGPLIVWLIKRDAFEFVGDQAKEALNAQISFTIYFAISIALMPLLIGFVLFPLVWLADLIFIIVAAVSANDGTRYRYPMIMRLVK